MDPSVKTTIEQRLVETGEKERLKEHLRLETVHFSFFLTAILCLFFLTLVFIRNRLIESGWREELKLHAKEVVLKDPNTNSGKNFAMHLKCTRSTYQKDRRAFFTRIPTKYILYKLEGAF